MKDFMGIVFAVLVIMFWVAWMTLIVWGLFEVIQWIGRH